MMHLPKKPWFHYLILFIGILCIAWSAIFVKLADVSGFGSAFYRMLFGFIGIIPLWIWRYRPIVDRASVRTAVLCGIFFGCDIALWNTSIMLTKASIATLLANLAPVWVGLGALLFLREKPKRVFWIGTLLSLVGVFLIVGMDKLISSSFNVGYVLALVASMFYGAYLLTTRKGRTTLDTISFTAISMLASSVLLFVLCVVSDTPLTGFGTKTWTALVGLGLVSQLGGWLAINFALGHISPTLASVSLLSQSVFTAVLSVPVLGEFLNWIEVAGALLVLTGIYFVNRKIFKPKPNVEPEF